jgi:hypothetical protein
LFHALIKTKLGTLFKLGDVYPQDKLYSPTEEIVRIYLLYASFICMVNDISYSLDGVLICSAGQKQEMGRGRGFGGE